MRKSQLRVYIVASGDRIVRNACMKGAIKISRSLKARGSLRASTWLLTEATRLFPMGARGDFGQKDLSIFGPHPEKLIAEYAAYLKQKSDAIRGAKRKLATTLNPRDHENISSDLDDTLSGIDTRAKLLGADTLRDGGKGNRPTLTFTLPKEAK